MHPGTANTYIKSVRGFFLNLYAPHQLVVNLCSKIQVNLSQVYNVLYFILPSVSTTLSRKLYLFPDPGENLMVMHDPDETHKSSFWSYSALRLQIFSTKKRSLSHPSKISSIPLSHSSWMSDPKLRLMLFTRRYFPFVLSTIQVHSRPDDVTPR